MRHAKVSAYEWTTSTPNATSTPVGEICETLAVKLALGAHARPVEISSFGFGGHNVSLVVKEYDGD